VLRPADPTLLMWRMLAQAEAAHASVAQPPIRAQAKADAAAVDPLTWPGAVLAVYLGERDTAWGLRAAAAADDKSKPLQVCQAAFYLGEKTLLDGARATARALLLKATAPACPPRAVEAAAARSELARLGR
jgi:lipoprotein NlpI